MDRATFGAWPGLGYGPAEVMNDDLPAPELEQLKQEHRRLDAEIDAHIQQGAIGQIELARLKKRKLMIKDQIQALMDASVPDIIA